MMNDQIQTKLIYNQEKVAYSSLSEVFEINFKKISRLVPLLPSIKDDLLAIKKPSNDLFLICHEKSKYTGTYTLTHQIDSSQGALNRPDILYAKRLELIHIIH